MSSTEIPTFVTQQPKTEKKERGSNITPKSAMRTRRNGPDGEVCHHTWLRQFNSYAKKLDREAYQKRSDLK